MPTCLWMSRKGPWREDHSGLHRSSHQGQKDQAGRGHGGDSHLLRDHNDHGGTRPGGHKRWNLCLGPSSRNMGAHTGGGIRTSPLTSRQVSGKMELESGHACCAARSVPRMLIFHCAAAPSP